MVEGRANLIVDLGNSETRVITQFGKTKKGTPRSRLSIFSNKFGELIDKSLLKNSDYTEENSKVFRVGMGSLFCSGEMCDKEKGTASERPSSSIKKYDSPISMYSMQLAFLQGYYHISDMMRVPVDSINVRWAVTVLLPPSDMDLGKERIKERVESIKMIDFLLPEFSKQIDISAVKVFPEGFCAFIGLFFENSAQIREGYRSMLGDATLVVDIGAGTTDLCIIKDMKLVDSSRYSEDIGGNQVFQKINTVLRKKIGKNLPEDSLREAAVKGKINIGAREMDISDIVDVARREVSTQLSVAIRNYIESSNFSIFDIPSILICGGGAEEDESNMTSLGEWLKKDLSAWMEYSRFLELPEYTYSKEDEDGVKNVYKERISPRLLNVIGASVLSEK